jgi:hypothetical protein
MRKIPATMLGIAGFTFDTTATRLRIDLEQATMRMVALCGSVEMVQVASAEAKRREAMMSPTDAMRSVGDDLAAGRIR